VKRVLEAADVYLCTSHDEGLGLPLLEAQFAGLPIVVPDKPVFREVLAGSGTFIQPRRADATADAIRDLIAPPNWRGQQAIAATSNIQRWNAVAGHDLAAARSAFSDAPSEHSPSQASVARHV